MFFIAYAFKGQVHVFAGQVKIVSHSSCRTSAILKYFCPLLWPLSIGHSHQTWAAAKVQYIKLMDESYNVYQKDHNHLALLIWVLRPGDIFHHHHPHPHHHHPVLINVQVHLPHQWAPLQVTGWLHTEQFLLWLRLPFVYFC